ncbi:BapA/Bap/LapF family large adhesin [Pseudomonas sp. NPDC007930]|uniref:BapA/Bap/LapF family large adhesin n=1 Tax=Pseudomonas sp. NPDC007930 TaxID=3364417 RepID=UPI0036EEE84F
MDNIVVADKATEQVTQATWGNVQLNGPGVVRMPVSPQQVASVTRNGQDLVVTLKTGERTTVNNFFASNPAGQTSDMVFQSDDGTLWQAQYDTQAFNGFTFEEITSIDELLAGAGVIGSATPEWAIAGLGLLGAGGAAAAGAAVANSGGSSGGAGGGAAAGLEAPTGLALSADGLTVSGRGQAGTTASVRDAAGNLLGSAVVGADGTFQVSLPSAQQNGENLTVDLTDSSGNQSPPGNLSAPDTTAPPAPDSLNVSADGNSVSGRAEAGATVQVRDAAGNVLGSAVAGADGGFSVALAAPQANGQVLSITAVDPAGNPSPAAEVTAPVVTAPGQGDTTAPAPATELAVSANGGQLSGRGEMGASVQATAPDGSVLGTGVVGADGRFLINLAPPPQAGEPLQVTLQDAAGNTSGNATVNAPDLSVPAAPSDLLLSADGLSLSGVSGAGVRILVRNALGRVIGSGRAGADGRFSVALDSAQLNGEALDVTATNAAGTQSAPSAISAADTSAPAPVSALVVAADGASLSGRGEAGATVSVRDAAGNLLGTTTVLANGTFELALSPAAAQGSTLAVEQADAAGNRSESTAATATGLAPVAPANVAVSSDGNSVTGTGTPGQTIEVRDASGTVIGTATVDANGNFNVPLPSAQTNGQVLDVVALDGDGNASVTTPVNAADSSAPAAATGLVVSSNGLLLSGRGEPGATVSVRSADGSLLGSAVVNPSGSFAVNLATAQTNGQPLQVALTDAAGNTSLPATVSAPDLDGSLALSGLALSSDGLVLTGLTQAGATVQVRDASGNLLGTTQAGAGGQFSLTLGSAQNNGQTLAVSANNSAGDSAQASLTAADTSAPAAVSGLALDASGLEVSGQGEPGARVSVRDANGTELGSATVAANGSFSVALSAAQLNGQALSVVQADAAGNVSPPAALAAADNTAPAAVTALALSGDGLVLSGRGEAGASVTVRGSDGSLLGTALVAANGTFVVNLSSAQLNGQALSVTQADPSGNSSAAASLNAADLTAPNPPTVDALSGDGLALSGRGEAGATVSVRSAGGTLLGSATVGADGSFSVGLNAAQLNGEVLQVRQADAAGNLSASTAYTAADVTAPPAPSALALSADGSVLSGRGEAGATVTVRGPDGSLLGSATVAANGVFSLTLSTPQVGGQTLTVSEADAAGNTSAATAVNAPDFTAPATPSQLLLNAEATLLTGVTSANASVEVRGADGSVIASGSSGADGGFSIALPGYANGERFEVSASLNGNTSSAAAIQAADSTAPQAPSEVAISADGLTITGRAEPASTVEVRNAGGSVVGTATVGADGSFSVALGSAANAGDALEVVAIDASNNASEAASVTFTGTELAAPSQLALAADGLSLTGVAVAGSTVTVFSADGSSLGSARVLSNGTFRVNLRLAQLNAQTLHVSASDDSGNTSTATTLTAADSTAPDAPAGLAFSAGGSVVSGRGEPGSSVTISAGNTLLGSGTVGANGLFSVTLSSPQTNGQALTASLTDAAGNTSLPASFNAPDLTPPSAAENLTLNAEGTVLSGRGEAGATVTVRDAAGNPLASGVVDQSGNFQVTLPAAQLSGASLAVTLTDGAGNASAQALIASADRTAPDAPAGTLINAAGSAVSGLGEPGATVTVRGADGSLLGSAVVAADGTFSVALSPAQANGQALALNQVDAAGNTSPAAAVQAPDITAPAPLQNLAVSADGGTLSGHGEPGATVTAYSNSGALLGSASVASDGSFSLNLSPAQLNAELIDARQADAAGNLSAWASASAPDLTPPAAPSDLSLASSGLQLSGRAEAGSTVEVRSANGALLGSSQAGSDGSFQLSLSSAQLNGQLLSVTATDAAGNVSSPSSLNAGDSTAPAAVTGLALSADGLTLAGFGEANAQLVVRDANGSVVGNGSVGANGRFSLALNTATNAGSTLTVVASDAAGNSSPPASVTAPDALAPSIPSELALSSDGLALSGSAEAGNSVQVRGANGALLGQGVADSSGRFSINLSSAQLNGERLSVTASAGDGSASLPADLTAADLTAPGALSQLALANDGVSFSGRGEAGATVTVLGEGGRLLGSAQVGDDGRFSLVLNSAQLNGERLSAAQADAAGNESVAATLNAPDLTAPLAPSVLSLSAGGGLLSGSGEAGSTVNVRGADGTLLGSATVRVDGSFQVTLSPAQANGQALAVTLTDAAGNVSASTPWVAQDTTAPTSLTDLSIAADGATINGRGEAGATVTVYNSLGSPLGSTTVAANGSFSLVLGTPLANAELLTLSQADAAGNVSPSATLSAPDLTAPDPLLNVAINAAGALVTGSGEPGATVTVKNAAGVLLGSTVVLANGSFAVALLPPQINAEVLSVQQADPPGNISSSVAIGAPDLTPPDAALGLRLDAGSELSGRGEAGATVNVYSTAGTLLGSGVVAANGTFSVSLSPAQSNGQRLSVSLTDAAGNVSALASLTAADTTAPLPPVAVLAVGGSQVEGSGEAGATVNVRAPDGTLLGSATVAADGSFSVALSSPQQNGQVLAVTLTDASNNTSTALSLAAPDLTAPAAPVATALSADGLTLSGTGEAGATLVVRSASGVELGSTQVAANGTFSVGLSAAQLNGQVLTVVQADAAGNLSLPSLYTAADTTPPAEASLLALSANRLQLAGVGEAGATVSVRGSNGALLGSGTVNASGAFIVTLSSAAAGGSTLQVTLTDTAGNSNAGVGFNVPALVVAAPTGLALSADGLNLIGLAEAGTTVTVYNAAGTALGSAQTSALGTFSVNLSNAQLNGQALHVVASSGAVSSVGSPFLAPDSTAPLALADLAVSANGSLLTGKGEAGATVTVRGSNGAALGSAVVASDGTFSLLLSTPQANGQLLSASQADAAGNVSASASVSAPDITPPNAATALAINASGLLLSGSGEAGASVRVYSASGALLASGSVNASGTFSITLPSAQLDGQVLSVRLVDGANNTSLASTVTALDTTAPAAPSAVAINASGTLVSGSGEPGASVAIRSASGALLGTGTVAANGSFSVALAAAQINLQALSVTLTDAAGNVSAAASVIAPDLTPPAAASALVVGADGLSLTGSGEAGATVTVRSASGSVLGTATVASNGVFSVTLGSAQVNGEALTVTLRDAAGNLSSAASVSAPDIDANTPVVASDNLTTAQVVLTPVSTSRTYTDSFTTVLSGFSKTFTFSVAAGNSIDPTLTLSAGSLVSLLNGVVYTLQVKDASGNWVTLSVNGSGGLLDLVALGSQGVRVDIGTLLAGDYRLVVSSTGIGVLTTVSTTFQTAITSLTQFTGVGTAVSGNVITDPGTDGSRDVTGPDNGAQLAVLKGGSYVAATAAGTVVQGLYGSLTLHADGSYTYTPNGSASSVGKVDVFSYSLAHPNGLSATATLYVRIDSPQATEIWSNSDLAAPATVVDATYDVASTAISLAAREVTSSTALGTLNLPLLGSATQTWSTSVATGAVSDLTVNLTASNLLSVLGGLSLSLYKQNASGGWDLVRTYSGNNLLALGGGSYGATFSGQAAGNYQIKLSGGGLSVLSSVTASLSNHATYAGQQVVSSYTPVAGNLLTDTAGGGADLLGSPFTVLSVLVAGNYVVPGYNGTSISGTYGTLLVKADGSYSYTLNSGLDSSVIGHQDVFTYELTHPNGSSDVATLTISLNQAGAALASQSFAALALADDGAAHAAVAAASSSEAVLQGTDGNDTLDGSQGGHITLNGGAGNDTLIIVDQQFASIDGGSGTDTLLWAGGDASIDLGNLASRIHNIEVLDLNTTSSVNLTLSLADLVAITEADRSTLLIKGNAGDSVHMSGSWAADGTQTADGLTYTQYTPQEDPTHHLWVQNGIHVV